MTLILAEHVAGVDEIERTSLQSFCLRLPAHRETQPLKLKLKKNLLHPAGGFDAKIVTVHEDTSQFGDIYKVEFLTKAGAPMLLCSSNYSERSKFGKLVKAALGSLPEDLDTEELEGKIVRIQVEHNLADDGNTYDRVTAVYPYQAGDPFAE